MNNRQFLEKIIENGKEKGLPVFGTLELTPFCNFDCKMCYIHMSDPALKQKMLGKDRWMHIIDQAVDKGMVICILTGGEAMTHPDFWEIYSYLINKGVFVRLKTNGLLLTEENLQKLNEFPPYMIDISLYGCDEASYESVTGKRVFDRIMDNIRNTLAHRIPIRLMITPSSFLMPYLEKTVFLAESFDVQILINTLLFEPKESTGRHKADFDLTLNNMRLVGELTKKVLARQAERHIEYNDKVTDEEAAEAVIGKGLSCLGGKCSFSISWDGIMKPCTSFPERSYQPML